MFSLPGLPEIDEAIAKEKGLLSGAEFINSSGELSPTGRKEVQEEIQFCLNRISKFSTLRDIVKVLHEMNFSQRPKQFASEEVIKEFKRLVGNATLVIDDFETPIAVDIKVEEI